MFKFLRTHLSNAACVFRHLNNDYVVSSYCTASVIKLISFFLLSARYKVTYGENSNVPDDLSRQYMYALKSSRQCFFRFLKTFNAQAVTAFPSSRQRRGSFSSILHNENSWERNRFFSQYQEESYNDTRISELWYRQDIILYLRACHSQFHSKTNNVTSCDMKYNSPINSNSIISNEIAYRIIIYREIHVKHVTRYE